MNTKKLSIFILLQHFVGKTRNIALSVFSLILLLLSSCLGQTESRDRDVPLFVDVPTYESAFVDYYVNEYKAANSDDKTTVYIFGFKESKDDERSLEDWRRMARDDFKNLSPHNYVSKDTSISRIYIALKEVDLEYAEKRYTANSKGIVKIENPVDPSKIRILNIKTMFGRAVPCDLQIASIHQRGNRKIVIYALGDNWISDM